MNEFNALRERARKRRDAEIKIARDEYEATLVQIATLEQDLLGKVSSRHKAISACIESVIPRDATFSTQDVMASLEAMDSTRAWRKRSIDNHFSRLRERNIIRRVRRATIHEPALYVRDGFPVETQPLADATLAEVIRMVLTKPMTSTEVLVAVVESGYQSSMARPALRNHVVKELGQGGFKRDGIRWIAD